MRIYREMLRKCRDQFVRYAENHMAKDPPQVDKATTNMTIAQEITAALNVRDPDVYHREMVARLQKPGDAILRNLTPRMAATLHMVIGLSGEAGELSDAIKKWAIYGKDLDRENVVEELGDIEFFLDGIRQNLGILREETLEHNMHKLEGGTNARYKNGYSDAAAIARADKEAATDGE